MMNRIPAFLVLSLALSAVPLPAAEPAPKPPAAETALADACADLVIDGVGSARWIVAEPGALADALARRAAARKTDLSVLPLRGVSRAGLGVLERAARGIPHAKVRDALDLGTAPFVLTWLSVDPEGAVSNVVLAALPSLPLAEHFAAVPDGPVFRLAREAPSDPETLRALAARQADFRDALGERLAGAPADAARARAEAARLAGLLGNNLGVLLAKAGLREEAVAAFRSADAIHPEGHSALLNLASLLREEGTDAERARLAARLDALASSGSVPDWTLAVTGGYVLRPQDFFQAGWIWTLSGLPYMDIDALRTAMDAIPEANRAPVLESVRPGFALQSGNAAMMLGIVSQMDDEGWTLPLALRAADVLFLQNERAAAQRLLWKAGKLPGADPAALALLRADYAARGGDAATAKREIAAARTLGADPAALLRAEISAFVELDDLPAARTALDLAAQTAEAEPEAWRAPFAAALAVVLSPGATAQSLAAAREQLIAATATETNFWPALRVALQLDLQSGNQEGAAADADALLAQRPFDYFGNYVAAMVAVGAGDSATAARHYQLSLSQRAAWFVLNDYASFLASAGNPALAERMARDALAATQGAVPAVHDTLGETLFAQKRWIEAAQAFAKAVETAGENRDPRFHIHLAEALLEAGDNAGAAAQLPYAEAGAASLSPEEQARIVRIRERIEQAKK